MANDETTTPSLADVVRKEAVITVQAVPARSAEDLQDFVHYFLGSNAEEKLAEGLMTNSQDTPDCDLHNGLVSLADALIRSANGDAWACASVTVTASWRQLSQIVSTVNGEVMVADDEADFRSSSDYAEMADEALTKLVDLADLCADPEG